MEDKDTLHPKPGTIRVLKKGFSDVYDYLGLVVASSFIWLVAILIPITAGIELYRRFTSIWMLSIGAVLSFVVTVALTAGLFYLAHKIVYRDDPSLKDLFTGFGPLFLPALILAFVDLLITAILAVDIAVFFGLFPATRELARNPVFLVMGVFFVWLTVFWLMNAIYHLPLLITTRYMPELEVSRPNTMAVLRRGLLLTASSPFFTMVFLFAIIALTILLVITRIGMAIFIVYPGIVAVILTHMTRALFISYGVIAERPDVVEDEGWRMGR